MVHQVRILRNIFYKNYSVTISVYRKIYDLAYSFQSS